MSLDMILGWFLISEPTPSCEFPAELQVSDVFLVPAELGVETVYSCVISLELLKLLVPAIVD